MATYTLALAAALVSSLLVEACGATLPCSVGTYGPSCASTCGSGDGVTTVAYLPAAANFSSDPGGNPGRGWYKYTATSAGSYSALTLSQLQGFRDEGYVLIYRIFVLDSFVSSDIRYSMPRGGW